MSGDLTEHIKAIHAKTMADIRGKLVNTTDHDLELLLERDKSPLPLMRIVAEQILAERKANEQQHTTIRYHRRAGDPHHLPDRDRTEDNSARAQRDGGRLVGLIRRIIDWVIARMFKDDKDWDQ